MKEVIKHLSGVKVLVTREKKQAKELSSLLLHEGAEVIEQPVISFEPPSNPACLADCLKKLDSYHWIIFTSVNGVKAFWKELLTQGISTINFPFIKVAAIGPSTKKAIEEYGQTVNLVPSSCYQAEGLLDLLNDVCGKRILIPRAEEARKILVDELRLRGAIVDEVAVYKTVKPGFVDEKVLELLRNNEIEVITFTSSSTVREFISLLHGAGLNSKEVFGKAIVACIGPITALEAQKAGITVNITSARSTIPDFVRAMVDFFACAKHYTE